MIKLSLVGIGAGNPRHLTLQAIEALNAADLILIPRKGKDKDDLARLRREICASVLREGGPVLREFDMPVRNPKTADYKQRVEDWHDEIAAIWQREIDAELQGAGHVAFLVWGDPALYDSTLRIAERLKAQREVELEVIPGVTAIQALTAGHAIPLNTLAGPFTVTTGRQLRDKGWPDGAQTLVIMLDGGGAFEVLDPHGIDIYWSAYAGMAHELRISGPLGDVADEIVRTRTEARARHGWIMDIYLLRKT